MISPSAWARIRNLHLDTPLHFPMPSDRLLKHTDANARSDATPHAILDFCPPLAFAAPTARHVGAHLGDDVPLFARLLDGVVCGRK